MTTPFLLILDGMTGAGKSTVARIIATHIPRLAVIGMDRVKRFVSDFERGERDNAIAKDIIFTLTQAYLDHDISVLIEEPFKNDEEIQKYDDLAQQRNIPIYKFQLYTTPERAFQRVVDRQKDAVNPVPEDRIRRNISLFTMREHEDFLKIDTSEIASEEVAKMILEKLGTV